MVLTRELLAELDDSDVESVDTDNISLTSTAPSEQQAEYALERILAERAGSVRNDSEADEIKREQVFLIKWEDYPLMRSTWEPEGNFAGGVEDTLLTWRNDQRKERMGFSESFPLRQFLTKHRRQKDRAHRRHARRRRKREREGYSPGAPSEASNDKVLPILEDSEVVEAVTSAIEQSPLFLQESGSDSDVPSVKRRRISASRQPEPHLSSNSTTTSVINSNKATSASAIPMIQSEEPTSLQSKSTALKIAPSTESNEKGYSRMTSALAKKPSTANMMRPSGSSKNAFRPFSDIGKQSILSNWDRAKEKRQTDTSSSHVAQQSTKSGHAPTLQARNRIQKASRRELPPTSIPELMDPATGAIIEPTFNAAQVQQITPVAHPIKKPTPSAKSPSPASPVHPRSTSTTNRGPLYTCWFWKTSHCSQGSECAFEHYDTGHIKQRNILSRDEMTCSYWQFSRCNKSDEACLYSHGSTNYIGPKPGMAPMRYDKIVDEPAQEQRVDESVQRSSDNRTMCYSWFNNNQCRKSAKDCKFAHQITEGLVRDNPRIGQAHKFYKPSESELQARTASNFEKEPRRTMNDSDDKVVPKDLSTTSHLSPPLPPTLEIPIPSPRPSAPSTTPSNPTPPSNDVVPSQTGISVQGRQQLVDISDAYTAAKSTLSPEVSPENLFEAIIHFQSESDIRAVKVRLVCTDPGIKSRLTAKVGHSPTLAFSHICVAEDVSKYIDLEVHEVYGKGDILPEANDTEALRHVSNILATHSAGAIYFHKTFSLVIYPVNPSWKFLSPQVPTNHDVYLQFHIISPIRRLLSLENSSQSGHAMVANMHNAINNDPPKKTSTVSAFTNGLDIRRLFRWNNKDAAIPKAVFLMFDLYHYENDVEELGHLFMQHDVEVYHSGTTGSWDAFRAKYSSGVVIFSPRFISYDRVKGLNSMIQAQFNFFQFEQVNKGSLPQTIGDEKDVTITSYYPTRIFPFGRAVLVTDDCFMSHTPETLSVIEAIDKRFDKPGGSDSVRLVGRPALMEWLHGLAEAQAANDAADQCADSSDLEDRLRTLELLLKKLHSSPEFLGPTTLVSNGTEAPPKLQQMPTTLSPIYYLSPAAMPEYASLSEKDPKKAMEKVVEWFMFQSCTWEQVRRFRRFYIITAADSKTKARWKNKWKLGDVMTPEKYVNEEQKVLAKTK